jgi:alkylated DNA repair dioxygenase AlkB
MDCEIDMRGASHKPGLDYRSHDITAIDCSLRFMTQAQLFQEHKTLTNLPEGMSYRTQLISEAHERALLDQVSQLPFKEFEFHGYKGKRRTVSFGWQYEFSGSGRLQKAGDIPQFLLPLRAIVGEFAELNPEHLQHVLVIEYGPGAGIGWHRDKAVFGDVIGVSLLSPCLIRFRRKTIAAASQDTSSRIHEVGTGRSRKALGGVNIEGHKIGAENRTLWQRAKLLAEPRSAYHLTGPARHEWQHSIPNVTEFRYSITFRSLV